MPEARPQPLQEQGTGLALFASIAEERAARGGERADFVGFDGDRFHRRRQCQGGEALAQHTEEAGLVAAPAGDGDGEEHGRRILVAEAQAKAFDARLARGEKAGQPGEQAAGGEEHCFRVHHRAREFEAGGELLRRNEPGTRIGHAAQGRIEVAYQFPAAAAGEARAGQAQAVAESLGADGGQGFQRGRRAVEEGHGQGRERRREFGGIADHGAAAGVGQQPRGQRRRRAGEACVKSECCAAGGKLPEQALQPAAEPQAGGNFQQHALGRIEADVGRELAGPGGEFFQRFGLGAGIAAAHGEPRRQGAGAGDTEAGPHVEPPRRGVGGEDRVPVGDGQGFRRTRAAQEDLQGQGGETEGDPEHGDICRGRGRAAAAAPAAPRAA